MADDKQMFLERQNEPAQVDDEQKAADTELLEIFRQCKKESFSDRWIWERSWMRNIHYVNNRHWIEYMRKTNEWRDVRLAEWIPKPINPLISNGTLALRAMFAGVEIGINVRPNGADPENVAVAAAADDYAPVLHEEHDMDAVMNEHDFWFIVTGNAFLHTYLERDMRHGYETLTIEMCVGCKQMYGPQDMEEMGGVCPCGSNQFLPATDPETGAPLENKVPKGKGVTCALSPFEIAFPSSYARFDDVPYIIRLRWRSKDYYENHPTLKQQTMGIKWSKSPNENSLQLFRSLPYHNDMGVAPFLGSSGGEEEGAAEYEVVFRPCDKYPDGFIFRVLGDTNPIVLHLEEDEAIPGPLPYRDATGAALFTYEHSGFEHRGGRVWATGPLDAAIPKVNSLNQLDSHGIMVVNRMANPLWLVPKGAEIEKFTGAPGLVVRWNPLTVNGAAKPERVDGLGLGGWFFQLREQYINDVEEAMGTFDVLKGSKPAGVEAFAALQLLVERGQSRFASAFKSRGRLYKAWFKWALEIEREFGPDERTQWVLSPAREWTQEVFKRANLQGSFGIIVEEGSQSPKTTLGVRAAIQHLNQLGFINPADPDQRYAIYQAFGQTKLSPALDIHMQAALRKQQAFEEWAQSPEMQQESLMAGQQALGQYEQQLAAAQPPAPMGMQSDPETGAPIAPDPAAEAQAMTAALPPPPSPTQFTPLKWRSFYDPDIHEQEFLKWANGDRVTKLIEKNPALEQILDAHLMEIRGAKMEKLMREAGPMPAPKPGGAGMAMANSNQEAGGTDVMPGSKGAAQEAT